MEKRSFGVLPVRAGANLIMKSREKHKNCIQANEGVFVIIIFMAKDARSFVCSISGHELITSWGRRESL